MKACPFIFLGGVVNPILASSAAVIHLGTSAGSLDEIEIPGFLASDFFSAGIIDEDALDPSLPNESLLYGRRNMFDLVTKGGKDLSGLSSELYIVVRDAINPGNNGVFRVVGAQGVSSNNSLQTDRLVVVPVLKNGALVDGAIVNVECRSPYTNTEDGPSSSSLSRSSAVIVVGDLASNWNRTGFGWTSANILAEQMILSLSVAYGPSRGATARVADKISRLSVIEPENSLLREAGSALDPLFDNESGVPENEVYFPVDQNPQTWSKLLKRGAYPPFASNKFLSDTRYLIDSYRESELFVDEGSKTIIFRPYQKLATTI